MPCDPWWVSAAWLFSLGLIGAGMLGVPVPAGSSAYAVSEVAKWRGTLDDHFGLSRNFYAVIAVGLVLGLALDFAGFDAVSMLFWAAVLNGVLAPPLIVHSPNSSAARGGGFGAFGRGVRTVVSGPQFATLVFLPARAPERCFRHGLRRRFPSMSSWVCQRRRRSV